MSAAYRPQFTDEAGWHTPYRDDFDGPPPPPPLPTLDIVQASSFAEMDVPTRPWLVPDLIPDRTVTMLTGDGGVGKSLLAKQLAVAVCTGTDWIGTLPEYGPVLYLSAEDDIDEVHRRLAAVVADRDISLADLGSLHIVSLAGRDAVLGAPEGRSSIIVGTPLWAAIEDQIEAVRPRLVVVDNLADAFAGNENSRTEARQFVGLLRAAAIKFDLAVLLIAHPSLTGISSGTGSSGSTAWSNSVRSRLYLDRAKADDGDEPDPDLRVLRTMKANYAATGAEIRMRWEKGRFRANGSTATTFDRIAADAKADRVFLDLLRSYDAQGRDVSPNPSRTYAPTLFAQDPDAAGIRNKAFATAMSRLLKDGKIKIETSGPPSKLKSRLVAASEC